MHNRRWQVVVIIEIIDAFVVVPVEISPGKLFLHVASRLERLHGFHDVKVVHILICQLWVLGHIGIFLGYHHSVLKKEFINPFFLGLRSRQERSMNS